MQKRISQLLVLLVLASLIATPLSAQDVFAADTGAGASFVYLPYITGDAQPPQQTSPEVAAPPQPTDSDWGNNKHGRVTPAERQAAAGQAAALGVAAVHRDWPGHGGGGGKPPPIFTGLIQTMPTVHCQLSMAGFRVVSANLSIRSLGWGRLAAIIWGSTYRWRFRTSPPIPGLIITSLRWFNIDSSCIRDLPATLLRGYVQLETADNAAISQHVALYNENLDGTQTAITLNGAPVYAIDKPCHRRDDCSYTKDRPVRILFRNLLPTGLGGNPFIPVDTTVMGAGFGPENGEMEELGSAQSGLWCVAEIVDLLCRKPRNVAFAWRYYALGQRRHAASMDHPANENTAYLRGVSAQNVPDMPDPGPGAMTYFTPSSSARLLFYHDHAWGITRLNVYALAVRRVI